MSIDTQEQALAADEIEYRGYRAQRCGRHRSENPYDNDSWMYKAWLKGYDAAFADADRKQDV